MIDPVFSDDQRLEELLIRWYFNSCTQRAGTHFGAGFLVDPSYNVSNGRGVEFVP